MLTCFIRKGAYDDRIFRILMLIISRHGGSHKPHKMEPESPAIGVVGLAGLFNACLETVARIEASKEFGNDSHALATQFHAIRLLFERWGRAIGLEKGQVSVHHHPSLDDQSVCLVVAEIISMIRNIVSDLGNPEDAAATKPFRLARHPAIPSAPLAPKRQKLAWALRGKERLAAEVETLHGLVRKLYELIPTGDSNKAAEISATNSDAFRKLQGLICLYIRQDTCVN